MDLKTIRAMIAALKAAHGHREEDDDDNRFDKTQPPLPLNTAARIEQARHNAAADDLINRLEAKKNEFDRVQQEGLALAKELENEQDRWGDAMRVAMPELKDVQCFWVNDEGTGYWLPKAEAGQKRGPQQPEWAKDLIASMQQEEDDDGYTTH